MDAKRTVIVSERTLQFLECKNAVSDVYDMFYSLMCEIYGNDQCNEIVEGKFLDISNEMTDFINKYMCLSIEGTIGNKKDFTEI
jgi:hypothetical protein